MGNLCRRDISQDFEREGKVVQIEGIPAYVCDRCGETCYPPKIGGKVVKAANQLFARVETKHRGRTTATIRS